MFKLFDYFLINHYYNGLRAFIPFVCVYRLKRKNGLMQVKKSGKIVASFNKVRTFVARKEYIGIDVNNKPCTLKINHQFVD